MESLMTAVAQAWGLGSEVLLKWLLDHQSRPSWSALKTTVAEQGSLMAQACAGPL